MIRNIKMTNVWYIHISYCAKGTKQRHLPTVIVVFRAKTCSAVDVYEHSEGTYILHLQSIVYHLFTQDGGSLCSSEILVPTYKTTWCNNTENHNMNLHYHENHKPLLTDLYCCETKYLSLQKDHKTSSPAEQNLNLKERR
jgi:hypothetical protein